MKYPAYPKYKSSGVEWLGNVPAHWEVKRLKDLLMPKKSAIKTGPFGSQLLSSEMYESDIKVYNQRSVIDNDFVSGENYISIEKFKELKEFETYPGDFLITTRGTIGRCAILPENAEQGILHPCLMRLQIEKRKVRDRFLEILIEESDFILEQLKIKSNGTTIDVIYQDSLKNVLVLMPPLAEQQAIADFLDCETERIDNLIDKKARLIEMLKEKRTALISHTVTKGLNSKVKMKPSGVEWLDDVPEHWEVKKIKYVTNQIIDGTHITPTYVNDGIPFLRVTDIQRNIIDLESVKFIPEEEHIELKRRCQPEPQDVLLSKNGTIGITKVIDWDWEFSIFVSLCLIKLKKQNVNSYFFSYQFGSHAITQQIVEGTKQTSVINLHLDKIKELLVILPLLAEQQAIVDYLDQETDKIDTLITKVETAIDKLKEYRTAIISAAVTGKINVSTNLTKGSREVA